MPDNCQYQFVGPKSASWDTVGALIDNSFAQQVCVIDEFGSQIILWLSVTAETTGAHSKLFFFGGFYAAPGGDEETWGQVVREYGLLQAKFAQATVFILGDGDAHFSGVSQHEPERACLECDQRPVDRRTQQTVENLGVTVLNDPVPTHESG